MIALPLEGKRHIRTHSSSGTLRRLEPSPGALGRRRHGQFHISHISAHRARGPVVAPLPFALGPAL
eukprot:15460987-Alexandrium_andersonii.AAC.1